MKKGRSILQCLLTLISISLILTSCMDDPEPEALDILPDVFMQQITEDSEEKYAVAFWAYGNKELESVTVDGPEGGIWTLEKDPENSQLFILFPEVTDYSVTIPETGIYEFTATSTQTDETPLTLTDELEDEVLGPVSIETSEYDGTQMNLTWETVTDADAYLIRLSDADGTVIFMSPKLTGSTSEYSFGPSTAGWLDPTNLVDDGETYELELLAILYESGVTTDKDYNIQFISIDTKEIVWGE